MPKRVMNAEARANLQLWLMDAIEDRKLPRNKDKILLALAKTELPHSWPAVAAILKSLDFEIAKAKRKISKEIPKSYGNSNRAISWILMDLIDQIMEVNRAQMEMQLPLMLPTAEVEEFAELIGQTHGIMRMHQEILLDICSGRRVEMQKNGVPHRASETLNDLETEDVIGAQRKRAAAIHLQTEPKYISPPQQLKLNDEVAK